MMIFKKEIPRRTFLRGMGATVALPLLDAMVPAFAGPLETAAKPAARLSFVYVPNGIVMDKWTPAAEGAQYEMTPILEPLAAFRDRFLVLSGLAHNSARMLPGETGGDHPRAGAAFLTGLHASLTGVVPKKPMEDPVAGVSVDQIAAKELGKHTQLASLELATDSTDLVGICDGGYSLAYINSISLRSATTPIPMENHPRAVFERLFGDSDTTDPAARLARIRKDRSILDSVTDEVAHLVTGLGPNDRAKLTEYLDAVRDVERRIHKAEEQSSTELPVVERPAGIPATFEEHVKLMFDLQVLACQCDLTRVVSFMMTREQSNRPYPEIGVSEAHHPLSHHKKDPAKIADLVKIDTYHAKLFAYFLEKLQSTPDGDGSLLDHMLIVYGSGFGDGNAHRNYNAPMLLAGGGAGLLKQGRHIRYPENTPAANLYLTMLDKIGIPVEGFGDSTGKLELLSV